MVPDPLWYWLDATTQARTPLTYGSYLPDWQAAGDDEARQRAGRFRRAWAAYKGQYPPALKIEANTPNDNVITNKASVIVNKGVAYLFGQQVTVQTDEGEKTPRETWLSDCLDALGGGRMPFLQKFGVNGGVCGHAFLRLLPADARHPFPRAVVLDPAEMEVSWEEDDIDDAWRYRIRYLAEDRTMSRVMAFRLTIERHSDIAWRMVKERANPDGQTWDVIGPAETWPHAWAPILHCQNLPVPNEFWGASDLEDDLLRLILARNVVLSNAQRVIRFYGHPRTWGAGFNADQVKMAPGELLVLPDGATLADLPNQADLIATLNFDRRVDEALHEQSNIPPVATGKLDNLPAISGVALKVLYGPLMEKTRVKQFTYGAPLVELARRLMILGGRAADEPGSVRPRVMWPEPAPIDPLEERQVALADKQLGASQQTLLTRLGYDAKEEAKQAETEIKAAQDALGVIPLESPTGKPLRPPRQDPKGNPQNP